MRCISPKFSVAGAERNPVPALRKLVFVLPEVFVANLVSTRSVRRIVVMHPQLLVRTHVPNVAWRFVTMTCDVAADSSPFHSMVQWTRPEIRCKIPSQGDLRQPESRSTPTQRLQLRKRDVALGL